MVLAVVRHWRRAGIAPPARHRARVHRRRGGRQRRTARTTSSTEHPDCFDGCTEAIGEVGGFSYSVSDDLRLYLIETAEKGIDWLRLHARGRPGHGSMINDDNAVTALAEAVARVGRHRFPVVMTPTVRAFLERGLRRARHRARPRRPRGGDRQARPDRHDHRRDHPQHRQPDPARRRLQGQRHPRPGQRHHRLPHPARAGGAVRASSCASWSARTSRSSTCSASPALETTFDGALVEAMAAALRAEDPGARPVPYMLSGGTDAKAFSTLGIRCFGFAPLRLPADLNFSALFHGIDERVPVDGTTVRRAGPRPVPAHPADRVARRLAATVVRPDCRRDRRRHVDRRDPTMTDQHAELDAALERVITAARDAPGRGQGRRRADRRRRGVAGVRRRSTTPRSRYDELLLDAFGEVTPWDVEAIDPDEADERFGVGSAAPTAEADDPHPQVISVRQRRDYRVPSVVGAAAGRRGGPARPAAGDGRGAGAGRARRRGGAGAAAGRRRLARRAGRAASWSRSTGWSWSAEVATPLDLEAFDDDDGGGPFQPGAGRPARRPARRAPVPVRRSTRARA